MRSSHAAVAAAGALLVAASLVVHGGLYQFVSAGPEHGYLVHCSTRQMWRGSGTAFQPVRQAPLLLEKDFNKQP